jgi:Tol biopolymer transport system component
MAFSKDAQWVAYVSYPEGTLWRSKVDGSDKLQLTYPLPSSYVVNPRWSPDATKIIFSEASRGKPAKMYEISSQGGSPQPLMPDDPAPQTDPNWSPDGSKVVFAGNAVDPESSIRIVDLTSHQVSTLPGSKGMFSTRWSPDGRYIASLSADMDRLLLFDFQTQKWTEIANGKLLGWPSFSNDGQYLQFLATGSGAVLRYRLSDHKTERIVDLKNFVYMGYSGPTWLAIAPDNSPLLLRDASTSDVYALDWEEP